MVTNDIPASIDDLAPEHITTAVRRLLGDDQARVTALRRGASEPFEYPKFGNKTFDIIEFDYETPDATGSSRMILRRPSVRVTASNSRYNATSAIESVRS